MNMMQAINNAMDITLKNDPTALVFGEDVGFGGVFRCALGLQVRIISFLIRLLIVTIGTGLLHLLPVSILSSCCPVQHCCSLSIMYQYYLYSPPLEHQWENCLPILVGWFLIVNSCVSYVQCSNQKIILNCLYFQCKSYNEKSYNIALILSKFLLIFRRSMAKTEYSTHHFVSKALQGLGLEWPQREPRPLQKYSLQIISSLRLIK